jgi:lysophospholipase L1-like esterase
MMLLIVEGGLRVFFAFRIGPRVLLYGTSHQRQRVFSTREPLGKTPANSSTKAARRERDQASHTAKYHENEQVGYSKYFPDQRRVDRDPISGEVFPVTINSGGFRGRNVATEKSPGTLRVVVLGASSTFGYYNRDDETYPVYLEAELNERCQGSPAVEVINLGIPHQTSGNIVALFLAEALPLDPDVVTFYEGANDGSLLKDRVRAAARTPLDRLLRGPAKRSVAFALVNSLAHQNARFGTVELFRAHSPQIRDEFLSNMEALRAACVERGIHFVVVSQQTTSLTLPRERLGTTSYQQEADEVRRRIEQASELSSGELKFLAHTQLMRALADWAEQREVSYVDGIKILDDDRTVLLSNVHLDARGNRLLASALADELQAHCPTLDDRENVENPSLP